MKVRTVVMAVTLATIAAAITASLVSGRGGTVDTVDLVGRADPTTSSVVAGAPPSSAVGVGAPTNQPFTTPGMPVAVRLPLSSGLRTGDVVTVRVDPIAGSQLFGVDARLCRGDAAVRFDGEFIPTQGGICTPTALSPNSDARITVEGRPPYGGLDVDFRVGTGSSSFKTQSGADATVTCDQSHPCQIVLKLQYPNGFGFQSVPLTFS